LNLFPKTVVETSKALFLNFGENEAFYCMQAIKKLRDLGIKVELYPDNIKVGKQFMHADKRGIPFAIIVGETEMNDHKFAIKNLSTGEQSMMDFDELTDFLNKS
jgi:histidyl-tRNA synthetase